MESVLARIPFRVSHAVLGHEPGDPCAGIDQQSGLSGRLLVDMLSAQIRHNERGIPQTPILSMVNGVWVEHPSLKAPTAKKRVTAGARR